jgi:hypothetical protein
LSYDFNIIDQIEVYDWYTNAPIYRALDVAGEAIKGETLPSFIFKGHKDEGFALDWSMKAQGR